MISVSDCSSGKRPEGLNVSGAFWESAAAHVTAEDEVTLSWCLSQISDMLHLSVKRKTLHLVCLQQPWFSENHQPGGGGGGGGVVMCYSLLVMLENVCFSRPSTSNDRKTAKYWSLMCYHSVIDDLEPPLLLNQVAFLPAFPSFVSLSWRLRSQARAFNPNHQLEV